jgi:hypothetical protein
MAIDLSEIPRLEVESAGVHFRYLVFRLAVQDQEEVLVRALNFRPYREELDRRIINWAWQSLEDTGLDESQATLQVGGGGSLAINPYYETVTLFGESPEYGPEEERETVARLFQEAFPEHEVSWYPVGHFEEQEKKAKAAKAAAAAARTEKKAQKTKDASQPPAVPQEEAGGREVETASEPPGGDDTGQTEDDGS